MFLEVYIQHSCIKYDLSSPLERRFVDSSVGIKRIDCTQILVLSWETLCRAYAKCACLDQIISMRSPIGACEIHTFKYCSLVRYRIRHEKRFVGHMRNAHAQNRLWVGTVQLGHAKFPHSLIAEKLKECMLFYLFYWVLSCILENRVPLKPMLEGVCIPTNHIPSKHRAW